MSTEVDVRSQIPHIGQISLFFHSRQITPQIVPCEALEQIVSKKLVSRSIEVTKGQKSPKSTKIGQILSFIERRELLKLNQGHLRSQIRKNGEKREIFCFIIKMNSSNFSCKFWPLAFFYPHDDFSPDFTFLTRFSEKYV